VYPERDQLIDLGLAEHAQRGGYVDVDGFADRPDTVGQLCHEPVVRTADGGDRGHRVLHRRRRLGGRLDQRRDVQPHRAYRRGEQAGLRAEMTVLGAAAGLE
jgi:hypothetical protein